MLPNTSAQETPTLPAIQIQEARYPTRGNRTPAPEPPKVIGCPPHELMTGDHDIDGLSTTFSEVEENDGDDDVCNTFDEVDDFDDDDLFYSDDELDEEFERELDEVARAIEYSDHKKFNHGRRRTTLIVGGPMAPNYEGKSDAEKASLKKEWEKKRKQFTDKKRNERLKADSLNKDKGDAYTGCLSPTLRTMVEVEKSRLKAGHTFPDKYLLKLRVAEEANLRGINFHVPRSEVRQYKAYGNMFAVEANNNETTNGFCVSICSVREGDEYSGLVDTSAYDTSKEKGKTPFTTEFIVPLILRVVAENPSVTNKTLRRILEPYGKTFALTDAIIQGARTCARLELFGTPEKNVMYAEAIRSELRTNGHIVEMKFTTRRETLKNIERIVIAEELLRRKHDDNSTLDAVERKVFWDNWKKENRDLIIDKLGRKGDSVEYLHGIFFTPSFAPATVPELKRLFMGDACHLNFGKYTLFSCYGVTANCNMSPVAFAIVFGNENGTTWKEFWKFVKEVHPTMNLPDVTIVTDQDKGQKSAISEVMDQAGQFYCAHHRRGNIIKMCGAASGNRIYSALWVYNRLVGCRTVEQIEREKTSSMPMMHANDARYLNNLNDDEQYPAARCNKCPGIYMYHRSTSAGVESMNGANIEMRARAAVDPLNALILLIKLECKRFNAQRAKAWASDCFLTPRGTLEYEEVFQHINCLDFNITIVIQDDTYECTVRRNMSASKNPIGKVVILKQPVRGSYFGTCSCGVVSRDSIPCEHMAALVVSSRIPDITRYNIMPYWWTTEQWKKQLPLNVKAICITNMETISDDHNPSVNYRYCPDWSAPNKAGRPKKNERRKSVLEKALGKRGPKISKRMTMFCQVCHAMSHITNDCWELEKNLLSRPSTWQSKLVDEVFDEFNEEFIVSASAGGRDEDELQDQEEGTAD
jgi:hypothetical protein